MNDKMKPPQNFIKMHDDIIAFLTKHVETDPLQLTYLVLTHVLEYCTQRMSRKLEDRSKAVSLLKTMVENIFENILTNEEK